MKLGAYGVVAIVTGFIVDVGGLVAVGACWLAAAPIAWRVGRRHGRRGPGRRTQSNQVSVGAFAAMTGTLLTVGIPPASLGLVGVGFDPTEQTWRWFVAGLGFVVCGFAIVGALLFGAGSLLTRRAPTHPATVVIRRVAETNVLINNRPRLEFLLSVSPADHATYDTTVKLVVPFTAIGSIGPGRRYRALVCLDKPSIVRVLWGEALIEQVAIDGNLDLPEP